MAAKQKPIKIKKENRGKFKAGNKPGETTQEHAHRVLKKGSHASKAEKKRAVFAENASHWDHSKGGKKED